MRQPAADDSQNRPLPCQRAVIPQRLMWRREGGMRIEWRLRFPVAACANRRRPTEYGPKRCLFLPFDVCAEP